MTQDNPWDWVSPEPPPVDISGERVTAILVTRNSARWLIPALESLAGLSTEPDRLIVVDNDSSDDTPSLLAQALEVGLVDAVIDRTTMTTGSTTSTTPTNPEADRPGFGAALSRALQAQPTTTPTVSRRAAADERRDWLWLLHDDIQVDPEALRHLLEAAVQDPTAALLGPKLLQPGRGSGPRRIAELGVSVAGHGRRVPAIDPGEVDQGQRDRPEDTLGLSTCGLLIRRDVWDALGGLDPDLPLFRDGVDLGWRAVEAGYRVRTCPAAEIVHRQAGRSGLRDSSLADPDPAAYDRRLGMMLVASRRHGLGAVTGWLSLLLGGLLRALGFALGKDGRRARSEWRAVRGLAGSTAAVRRMRARHRQHREGAANEAGMRRAAELRPRWWAGPALALESAAGAVANARRWVTERPTDGRGADEAGVSLDDLTGDAFAGREDQQPPWGGSPALLGLLVATVTSLVTVRAGFGAGALHGPQLLPSPDRLAQAWASYLGPVPGQPGLWAPPWLGLQALGSTLSAGRPDWWTTLLVWGALPLAYLSAVMSLRGLLPPGWSRTLLSLAYAATGVLATGALARGDLQVAGLAIVLPLYGHALGGFSARDTAGPDRWRSAGQLVLFGAVVAALWPMLGLIIGVAVLAAAAVRRNRWGPGVAAALGPWLLMAPWWLTLIRFPGRLLTGPDPALGSPAPASWFELLLARSPGTGLPPLWLSAVALGLAWLAALLAGAGAPRRRLVGVGLALAVAGFALGVLSTHQVVAVPPVGEVVRPGVGGAVVVMIAGLLLAIASAWRDRPTVGGWRGLAPVAAVVLALSVAAVAVSAAVAGAPQLRRDPDGVLPPFVERAATSPAALRALVVDLSGEQPRWVLSVDGGTRLGATENGAALGGSVAAQDRLREAVSRLAGGSNDAALAGDLADLGIGYLSVRGASTEQISGIENTPGLGVGIDDRGARVFPVAPTQARMVVSEDGVRRSAVGPDGTLAVPAGGPDRILLLGEPADPRWRATVNGVALTPIDDGRWQQRFALPAAGGTLRVEWHAPVRPWLTGAQAVLALAALVAALPTVRRPEPATGRRAGAGR